MLSNTLNTNEVKNASGSEVEFTHLEQSGRSREFALLNENPSLPHRLLISHQESGKGIKARRRSVVRIDKASISTVDSVSSVTSSAYLVLDIPVGAISDMTDPKAVLAEVTSFIATLGNNTFLYDGTGAGAAVLLSGGL